jgi:Protein of unknown function (DUF3738)
LQFKSPGERAIHMEWSAEPGVGESVPGLTPDVPDRKLGSILTEIQRQLGLCLESRRAPAEIVVVDSAELLIQTDFPSRQGPVISLRLPSGCYDIPTYR